MILIPAIFWSMAQIAEPASAGSVRDILISYLGELLAAVAFVALYFWKRKTERDSQEGLVKELKELKARLRQREYTIDRLDVKLDACKEIYAMLWAWCKAKDALPDFAPDQPDDSDVRIFTEKQLSDLREKDE